MNANLPIIHLSNAELERFGVELSLALVSCIARGFKLAVPQTRLLNSSVLPWTMADTGRRGAHHLPCGSWQIGVIGWM
jgi:hypothetical protein